MGDLISRSAMLRHFSDWQMECSAVGSEREYNLLYMAIKGIKNEPSAFDMEKVIQQINDAIMPTQEHRHKFCGTVEPEHCVKYENCEDCMAERMIEIVKKGGV